MRSLLLILGVLTVLSLYQGLKWAFFAEQGVPDTGEAEVAGWTLICVAAALAALAAAAWRWRRVLRSCFRDRGNDP